MPLTCPCIILRGKYASYELQQPERPKVKSLRVGTFKGECQSKQNMILAKPEERGAVFTRLVVLQQDEDSALREIEEKSDSSFGHVLGYGPF